MKVLLLGFTKISYMPYMYFYIEQLKQNDCEVHLIYWKRDDNRDTEEPKDVVVHMFDKYQQDTVPIYNKLGSFHKYRRYALNILKKHTFDLIVVLHSTPGVLLSDVLVRKYKKRYILDYRDFTYENLTVYKKIIHMLVNNSAATFVSSDAYRKYMPLKENIYTSHNLEISSLENREVRKVENRVVYPIKIRFWGFIRHEKINMTIINKLANDERFELHYHGRGQKSGEILMEYCNENNYKNIFFHGEYKPKDKYKFIQYTDLVHNIYENDIKTINAMGNKYYDGINYYIPQICNENSFMGDQVKNNKIGISINPDSPKFADEIDEYYKSINWSIFRNCCDSTLNEIIVQYNEGINLLEKIFKGKKGD